MEASAEQGGAYGFSGGENDTSTMISGLTRILGATHDEDSSPLPPPESTQEAHQDQGILVFFFLSLFFFFSIDEFINKYIRVVSHFVLDNLQ